MPITLPTLPLPTWSQTKHTSKVGFDKVYGIVDKLGAPVNKLSNRLGSEAFWPTSLDKESDKAARILRSFCKDGFYVEEEGHAANGDAPKGKQRVVKKIPTEVIKNAKGLAIFTTMRTGLWVSGAGGSGILVARKADGEWSPPSGILLHTAGLGFLVGVDIYDCVVVINTDKALEAFTKIRATLGGEISAVAGPVGAGGILETELHKRQAPVFNYLKSRGFYAGVQIDGTVIIERGDENEKFYGEKINVANILAGNVRHIPYETKTLMATIKAAQGEQIEESALPAAEPTPGDYEAAEDPSTGFGLPPAADDPDPFGVHALEHEGMEIREAGTKSRPSSEAFEYRPSPSSPVFATFARQSSIARRNSKRTSGRLSISSIDRGTQTDLGLESPRFDSPKDSRDHSPITKTSENLAEEDEEEDGEPDNDDKVEIHEAPVISKAKLVTIPKRIPPALPVRSPYRSSHVTSIGSTLSSPSLPEHPELPEPTETGLGIDIDPPKDVHPSPTLPTPEEKEDAITKPDPEDFLPIQSQDIITHTIDQQIHLTPRQDLDRLSPHNTKDGFDEVSMSGSDYSRGTPAETPITTHDSEASSGLAIVTGKENEPAKGLALVTGNAEEEEEGEETIMEMGAEKENEDFHSMPGTPFESAPPPLPLPVPSRTSTPVSTGVGALRERFENVGVVSGKGHEDIGRKKEEGEKGVA